MHSPILTIDTNLIEDSTCHGTKHKTITKINRISKVQIQQQFHRKREIDKFRQTSYTTVESYKNFQAFQS
jgi:hypothetical protein